MKFICVLCEIDLCFVELICVCRINLCFASSRFVFYSNLCFEQNANSLFGYCNLSFEKANLLCFKTQITKFKTQIYPKISKISTGSKHKFQKANLLYFDHICVLNLKFAFWNTEFPLVMNMKLKFFIHIFLLIIHIININIGIT